MMFVAPIGRRSFFLLNVLVVLARVETMHADVLDSLKVSFHLLLNVKGGKVVSEGDEKKKVSRSNRWTVAFARRGRPRTRTFLQFCWWFTPSIK